MKTNQNHQRIAEAFDKLFRTYPQFAQGSTPEELTRDRVEKAKVYFEAVAIYPECDVEAAVASILSGTAPGMNPNFAPPAPAVAHECRRQMDIRLRAAELDRIRRPALPAPTIEHSPESRERIKALLAEAAANLASVTSAEDKQREIEIAERWQRTNEAFRPDMSDDAIAERLMHRPRYTAGDRDGDRDIA